MTVSSHASTQGAAPQSPVLKALHTYLRGAGQVMFQGSAWTGLFFLIGIFWGSYASGLPQVAWGAVVGCLASTIAGYAVDGNRADADEGLWGFNGILVGCAFPTFLSNTWQMWIALILCAAMTTWVRKGFNNVMSPWKVNSLTFPFVFLTWLFLFAAKMLSTMSPDALSTPALTETFKGALDTSLPALVEYWLKGISQVFLVNSWVTGVLFLIGLAICNRWAAIWAAVGSAISLALAIMFGAPATDISAGLFGFSPVLTGIAIGCTFYNVNIKSAVWAVMAIIATFFIQAGMDAMMMPFGLPTLTGPFCITTWLFLLPLYNMNNVSAVDHTEWHTTKK